MIASAIHAIAAFDLVCAGTMRTGPIGLALPEKGGEPFAITYRIDLASRSWCSDDCAETEPLASSSETDIVLREEHSPSGSRFIRIALEPGSFTDTLIFWNTAILRSGHCDQAPFTGFPDPQA
jgi:hypothetical protein